MWRGRMPLPRPGTIPYSLRSFGETHSMLWNQIKWRGFHSRHRLPSDAQATP